MNKVCSPNDKLKTWLLTQPVRKIPKNKPLCRICMRPTGSPIRTVCQECLLSLGRLNIII